MSLTTDRNSESREPRSRNMLRFTVSLVVSGPGVKRSFFSLIRFLGEQRELGVDSKICKP